MAGEGDLYGWKDPLIRIPEKADKVTYEKRFAKDVAG